VPIVNEDGSLRGVLSTGDIAEYDMSTISFNRVDKLPLFNLLSVIEGTLVNELAIVGGVLIISSGLSILDIKDCKTLNYIPALLVPLVWFLVKGLF
jgi:uncharacterized membrane protein YqgA involved in biofilm formation